MPGPKVQKPRGRKPKRARRATASPPERSRAASADAPREGPISSFLEDDRRLRPTPDDLDEAAAGVAEAGVEGVKEDNADGPLDDPAGSVRSR